MSETVSTLQIKVLSQDVESAGRRLAELERKSGHAETAVGKLGSTSRISFGAIAAGIGSIVSLGAATGMVTRQWLNYDKAMKEVQSITSSTSAEFKGMRNDVVALSTALGVDATIAAQGLYQALSAGIPKENAIDFMKVASKAAIAGVTEVNVAVDGLTNVINAYKLPVTEAERVTDMLFATVVDGKTTFEELSSNMSKATVIAASMNVPLEQVLASIISITKQGTPTSEAFTQIKAALQAMLDPSKEMLVAYKSIGVESGRQAVAQYGLAGALQMVRDRYEGNDAALVKAMRSVEAYNGALSITGTNLATYSTGLDNVLDSAGKANKAFADNSNTLSNALTSLKGSFIGFVEALEQRFGAIETASRLLKELAVNLSAVQNIGLEGINSAVSMGGAVGVQRLQDEIAKLEALQGQLEAGRSRGQMMTGRGRDNGGFGEGMTAGARFLSTALEETETKLARAREALAGFNKETVTSANLQRALADATRDGNEAAVRNIQAKIDGQEQANAAAAEQADILKEVGELEVLLREQKVKMADEQLKKDKEIAKERDQAVKDEKKALENLKVEAERLTTTDRQRLELKIKQLEVLKAQGPEEAALAEKAIKAIRDQIVEYDKLQAKRGGGGGGSVGGAERDQAMLAGLLETFDMQPIFDEQSNSLFAQLEKEEDAVRKSYEKRMREILSITGLTEAERTALIEDANRQLIASQASFDRERQAATLGEFSNFFGDLASIQNAFGEKGFKVAQGAAIAQATIKMYESATSAYAAMAGIPYIGPALGVAAAGAAIAAGAANIAAIKSQKFQAYEYGGMIPAGSTGLVGEAGPEFVRGPAIVTSARATDGLRSGKAPVTNFVVNNYSSAEIKTREEKSPDGKTISMIVDVVLDRAAKEVRRGGNPFSKSLEETYPIHRGQRHT